MAYCSIHGYDHPECNCNPFSWRAYQQRTSPGNPPITPDWTSIVFRNLADMQLMATLLGLFGYEVHMSIETQRLPLHRHQQLVMAIRTNAPVPHIMSLMQFILQ